MDDNKLRATAKRDQAWRHAVDLTDRIEDLTRRRPTSKTDLDVVRFMAHLIMGELVIRRAESLSGE
jgi:hypothetical protein